MIGLAYRSHLWGPLLRDRAAVEVLELTAEHWLSGTAETTTALADLARQWPLLVHGLDLSLGSDEGPDPRHLDQLAALITQVRPPWWSEHLALTRAGGRRLGHLAPLARTSAQVAVVARNVDRVRRGISVPLILENIACPLDLGGDMDDPAFCTAVADATGCGLLLDVSNAWLGCANRSEDFRGWLDRFPLDRVVQLHVAGFRSQDGLLVDSHADPLADTVVEAVAEVLNRCRPQAVILERDDAPPWPVLRAELDRLR